MTIIYLVKTSTDIQNIILDNKLGMTILTVNHIIKILCINNFKI